MASPLPNPVIVVPGITASYLRDFYSISPETIWSVLTRDYERAALHPDDIRAVIPTTRAFEAVEPAHVRADQVYEIAYRELIEELRHNLRNAEDEPVPVFAFGYDWRQPLETIEDELFAFVLEVRRRTSLLRHYHAQGYGENSKVNLIGHSMGGLLIADCIARHGKNVPVGKVVSLASPFQGSFESVVKVTTGTANLGTTPPSSREREAARVTPALYYLIPSLNERLQVDNPALPKDLFETTLWQQSIFKTLAEYIRLHGVQVMSPDERITMAHQLFAAMLAAARNHRKRLDGLNLPNAGLQPSDWLCVVGVNSKTRVRLRVAGNPAPEFSFGPSDIENAWTAADDDRKRMTGDGTVPFEGAVPKFLPYESLVCVRPNDFSLVEIADRATLKLAGFHGVLPNMNMLHRLIVRFFKNAPDPHGTTWGLPPPGVPKGAWMPPLPLDSAD